MVTIRRQVRPSGKEGDRRFESARRLDMRDNVELIESLWEAFASADIEAFAAAIADDGEIVFPESVPWGGSYRGPEGRAFNGHTRQGVDQKPIQTSERRR